MQVSHRRGQHHDVTHCQPASEQQFPHYFWPPLGEGLPVFGSGLGFGLGEPAHLVIDWALRDVGLGLNPALMAGDGLFFVRVGIVRLWFPLSPCPLSIVDGQGSLPTGITEQLDAVASRQF